MTRMMQSMVQLLFEVQRFNALLIFFTLILPERFSIVFGITVNPLDSILSSSDTEPEEFIGPSDDKSHKFASEVYDLNNIDYSQQLGNDFNKFTGSQTHGSYDFGSSENGLNHYSFGKRPFGNSQSDSFSEYLKMITLHHSAFEVPSYFTDRISVRTRFVSPQPSASPLPPPPTTSHVSSFPVRAKIVRPVSSPLNAITDGIKDRLKAIYPGTLWCGDGNQAKFGNEVGLFRNTDICCKQHDQCPAFIRSGSEFKGLRNNGLFTRSHCDCDMKFYNCLKRTNSIISNKIGYTYFNILRPQCFRKEYPIVGCKKMVNKKCYVYMVDDQQTPLWQWFENKPY